MPDQITATPLAQFFVFDERPVRILTPDTSPEVLFAGKWHPLRNSRFPQEARAVSQQEFLDVVIREYRLA